MKRYNKATGRATTMPVGFLAGTAASAGVTLLLACGLTTLADKEILTMENMGYWIAAVILLSAWAGAWTAKRKIQRRTLLVCAGAGICYFCLLMTIPLLFFGGEYGGVLETALLILAGCMLPVLLKKQNRPGNTGKKQKRYKVG